MKNLSLLGMLVLIATTLSSCELIEGIFKAGVWTGIIAVVVVLGLIIWLVAKIFGGGKD